MYGFHEVFLRRVFNETIDAQGAAKALPLIMLGVFALPLAAAGYELRKLITGRDLGTDDGLDYMWEITQRSGMLGVFQFLADMEAADDFGKPGLLGIGGPSAEQAWDIAAKDAEAWLPRAVPVAAGVPWLREEIRDVIDD